MLVEVDYKNVFLKQLRDVEKSRKKVLLFAKRKSEDASHSLQKLISGVNVILVSQLLQTKGALEKLREEQFLVEGSDATETIALLNSQLNSTIQLHAAIEQLGKTGSKNNFPEWETAKQAGAEAIENLYAILRLLKKANRKARGETSPLAKDAAKHSLHSLSKIENGR